MQLSVVIPVKDEAENVEPLLREVHASLVRRARERVEIVEVGQRPRLHGRTKYGIGNRLWVGLVDLAGVMWLQRRMRHPRIEEEA